MGQTAGGGPVAKTLHNSDMSGTVVNVPDVVKFGDPDMWQLLCKSSSVTEGWMKSTKAMFTGEGCSVQVTTQQRNPDGSYAVAEAVHYVPGVYIFDVTDEQENVIGRILQAIDSTMMIPAYEP